MTQLHIVTEDIGIHLASDDQRMKFELFVQALANLEKAVKEQEAAKWKIQLDELLDSDNYARDPDATRFNAQFEVTEARNELLFNLKRIVTESV